MVHSRSQDNASAFARDFGVAEVAASLAAATQSSNVDAFYIATPPTAHRAQALACLGAGKPVLIEKPFAASRADAAAIADMARAQGVFCMEGMWTRFLPASIRLRTLIKEGVIGTPRSLSGSFGASNIVDEGDNQFRPDLGGGALLHRGIYALSMAIDLLGPATLAASAATLGATGVDEDCVVVLRHTNGALATLRSSLRAPLPNTLTIEGTHGLIKVSPPIYRPFRIEVLKSRPTSRGKRGSQRMEALRESASTQGLQQCIAGRLPGRGPSAMAAHYRGNGYGYEADEVARCVRQGAIESDVMPLDQSVEMVGLMGQARLAWLPEAKT